MPNDERRREPRAPMLLVVEYDGVDALIGDYTANLSLGGTFVATDHILPVGTSVELSLSFPGLLESVRVQGTVVRVSNEEPRGIGVEFSQSPHNERAHALLERIAKRAPGTQSEPLAVLLADDNPHVLALVQEGLHGAAEREFEKGIRFEFTAVETGDDALLALERQSFDLAIIDFFLPGADGVEVIAKARQRMGEKGAIVVISGAGPSAKPDAMHAGATLFLDKPMRLQLLLATVKSLLSARAS